MSRRRAFDANEDARPRPVAAQTADLPMWATSGEVDVSRQVARLVPVALELAENAGRAGITVSDLRVTAENRGILTGEEAGKRLSYLGSVMEAAGLVPTESYRRSVIRKSHANLHRVFVHPKVAA